MNWVSPDLVERFRALAACINTMPRVTDVFREASIRVFCGRYLLVIVSGVGGLASYCAVVSFVAELLQREPEDRVLVDLLGSQPSFTRDEHRQLGEQVRRLWTGVQVAVVAPTVERVLIGEEAAKAGGANIRTFTDLHEAGDWLTIDSQPAQ
jgi:hypothetical protein